VSIEKIFQDVKDIRLTFWKSLPHLIVPLNISKIILTKKIDTAAANNKGEIFINGEYWSHLSFTDKKFTIAHECLHLVLLHPQRMKKLFMTNDLPVSIELFNYIADAKINYYLTELDEFQNGLQEGYVTMNFLEGLLTSIGASISRQRLLTLSVEEIYKIAVRKMKKEKNGKSGSGGGKFTLSYDDGYDKSLKDDLTNEEINYDEKDVIYEGKGRGKFNHKDEKQWKNLAASAHSLSRQAGRNPGELERLFSNVYQQKPPWPDLFRYGVRTAMKFDSSFSVVNRRADYYPGYYGYEQRIWVLVDTSGSISEKEIERFLGYIMWEAKNAKVFVVPWDTKPYGIIEVKKAADVARKCKAGLKGGGGTEIRSALEFVDKKMGYSDVVIILTDGYIFDSDETRTKSIAKRIASKASFKAVGYTEKKTELPGFTEYMVTF